MVDVRGAQIHTETQAGWPTQERHVESAIVKGIWRPWQQLSPQTEERVIGLRQKDAVVDTRAHVLRQDAAVHGISLVGPHREGVIRPHAHVVVQRQEPRVG